MSNYKLVPNQKEVKVNKEPCNKNNIYAAINLQAMEQAAINLDAPSFKLWVYFAKNQNGYEFALSSKDVADTFGMKRDQYNRAIEKLIAGGYLVEMGGSKWSFNELAPQAAPEEKIKVSLQESATTLLQQNTTTALQENATRALQDFTTRNNTIDNIINTTQDNIQGNYSKAREIELSLEELQRAPSRAYSKQEKIKLFKF